MLGELSIGVDQVGAGGRCSLGSATGEGKTVLALGQLRPPQKRHVGPPLSSSKIEGIGDFTQNAVFTQFHILCIFDLFVRFFMNKPDGYKSCQPCTRLTRLIVIATLISLQISQLMDMF